MIPTTTIATTSLWSKLMKAHPSGGQPYDKSQSLQKMEHPFTTKHLKQQQSLPKQRQPADISELKKKPPLSTTWSKLFQQSVNRSTTLSTQEMTFLKQLLMNLAKTNPNTSLQTFQSPEPGKLRPTLITTLWQSAQHSSMDPNSHPPQLPRPLPSCQKKPTPPKPHKPPNRLLRT